MKKFFRTNKPYKQAGCLMLLAALLFHTTYFPLGADLEVTGADTDIGQEINENSDEDERVVVTEDAAIALSYVTSINVDQPGRILRLYGDADESYQVPIVIATDSSLILDHVNNQAEVTVAAGVTAHIYLRGDCSVSRIDAVGGSQTNLWIEGDSEDAALTTGQIACASQGTTETGGIVHIKNCTISSQSIGCGGNGLNRSYNSGSANVASAAPGSNASPLVELQHAVVSVTGSIACGGNGVQSTGTWSATASSGGTSGEVRIEDSRVTVSGNISIGGQGGNGGINSTYYNCVAGQTRSSSDVTISDGSQVAVAGNVATQPGLPSASNGGKQTGLNGRTVTVSGSTLTAKDIASGGAGHKDVAYSVYSGSGSSYTIYGTAGGSGGTLVADHATISCATAVCGANAGDYQCYEVSMYGNYSGDYACKNHPKDGNGGSVFADTSALTFTGSAGAKGSRWDAYENPSIYGDSTLIGGSLTGKLYGNVITTDLTSLLDGSMISAQDIRNSQEASCALSELHTSESMANQQVEVTAGDLSATSTLDETGTLKTYLAVGKEVIRLAGGGSGGVFAGSYMVRRAVSQNIFYLFAYGTLNMENAGASIGEGWYVYDGMTYEYSGSYLVQGQGPSSVLEVESGIHVLTLDNTSFDTLAVTGDAVAYLHLSGDVNIRCIEVADTASLFLLDDLESSGEQGADKLDSGDQDTGEQGADEPAASLTLESCNGLKNSQGIPLHILTLCGSQPGDYELRLNDRSLSVTFDDTGSYSLLLPEDTYELCLIREPFRFYGTVSLTESRSIEQDDLTLYVDCSQGDIRIGEDFVSVGDEMISTRAKVYIDQSGEPGSITVERSDATILLGQADPDTKIYLPEDFTGTVRYADSAQDGAEEDAEEEEQPSPAATDEGDKADSDPGQSKSIGSTGMTGTSGTAKTGITSSVTAPAPELKITSSLDGISFFKGGTKNTYRIYTRKSVTFSLEREEGCRYYYKILDRGQSPRGISWQELTGDKLKVTASGKGQRVLFRAVNDGGCISRKTSGFVIDKSRPSIKGVKNGVIYRKGRSIRVTDDSGVEVTLNGQKKKASFTLNKRGIYLLTAEDPAGNSRRVLFAIL